MRYAIVIEKANGNYSAYVPDLPGCVAGHLAARVHPQPGAQSAINARVQGPLKC